MSVWNTELTRRLDRDRQSGKLGETLPIEHLSGAWDTGLDVLQQKREAIMPEPDDWYDDEGWDPMRDLSDAERGEWHALLDRVDEISGGEHP